MLEWKVLKSRNQWKLTGYDLFSNNDPQPNKPSDEDFTHEIPVSTVTLNQEDGDQQALSSMMSKSSTQKRKLIVPSPENDDISSKAAKMNQDNKVLSPVDTDVKNNDMACAQSLLLLSMTQDSVAPNNVSNELSFEGILNYPLGGNFVFNCKTRDFDDHIRPVLPYLQINLKLADISLWLQTKILDFRCRFLGQKWLKLADFWWC